MKFRIKIPFDKKPSEVYQLMCSTNAMVKWEKNFNGFQPVKGQKRRLGSIGNRIYHEPDGEITKIKEEITEVKKNQLLAYQLTHNNFLSYVECKFIDQGGQTLLIEDTDVKFRPAILNLVGFFMKGSMKKQREADLNKFKELLNNTK